jgi:hypothetical protein
MTLLNVADTLANILGFESISAGNLDSNLDRAVGVYNPKQSGNHKICIGGKACTKTLEKRISILIHWTDNPTVCEQEAELIMETLTDVRNYKTDNYTVHFISCNNPVDVGRDDRGTCEYVIEANLYYERND